PLILQGFVSICESTQDGELGAAGFEQATEKPIKPPVSELGAAKSAAFSNDSAIDSQLRIVVDAWAGLSSRAKDAIAAIAAAGKVKP
ncbi:MAG: hypothetical protein ACP5O7_12560, partial [Phycisphaerae bacterium]